MQHKTLSKGGSLPLRYTVSPLGRVCLEGEDLVDIVGLRKTRQARPKIDQRWSNLVVHTELSTNFTGKMNGLTRSCLETLCSEMQVYT